MSDFKDVVIRILSDILGDVAAEGGLLGAEEELFERTLYEYEHMDENALTVLYPRANDVLTPHMTAYTADHTDAMFFAAAQTIAFDDLTNAQISKMIYHGRELHYAGRQPGMLIEFLDEDNRVIWSRSFENWDH